MSQEEYYKSEYKLVCQKIREKNKEITKLKTKCSNAIRYIDFKLNADTVQKNELKKLLRC